RRVHVVEVPGQCSGHAPTVQVRRTGIRWSMTVAPLLDTDVVARHTLAHDASHYLLLPEAVTAPADEAEVVALLREATRTGRAVTFRSGGASLSGQAQSAQVLADVRTHFRGVEVLDAGARVRV